MSSPSLIDLDPERRSIVAHPDTAVLRADPRDPRPPASGYRHVYHAEGNSDRWVARVKLHGRLLKIPGPACRMPCQAALLAVRWYQERYGPEWKKAIGRRVGRGNAVIRSLCREATYVWENTRLGGYLAAVWELGRRVELTGKRKRGRGGDAFDTAANCRFRGHRWKRPGRLLVFATRESAEAAVRAWIAHRWGAKGDAGAIWRESAA